MGQHQRFRKLEVVNNLNTENDETMFEVEIKDTASGSGTKLINCVVDGTSVFSIDKSGNITSTGDLTYDDATFDDLTIAGPLTMGGMAVTRFHDTITLDTGDATTDVGLTPNGVILHAAIRVSTAIADLDSADHHIQLGVSGTTDKYIDVANGSSATSIAVNTKDKFAYNGGAAETAALILTITGGADQTPSAGAVEVEVIYLAHSDLADV